MRAVMAWMMFASVASVVDAAPPVAIGYLPAFKGFATVLGQADLRYYTHVDLAFANPGPKGEFVDGDRLACAPAGEGADVSFDNLRDLVERAHRANAKVLISVGGGTLPPCSGDWAALVQPTGRAQIVAALLDLVDRSGVDGIDIDLEGDLLTRIDQEGNYTPLVRQLFQALHSRSKLLTCATASYAGGMVPDSALPYFDLIGIMSYDAVGDTWGRPGDEHASYDQAEHDLALWLSKGVPASRLALGLPFYGRGFGSYRPHWALHEIEAELGRDALTKDVAGNRCPGCDYVTFNGLPTLERKARLAGAWGAGVMVWAIDQDLPDGGAIRRVRAALEMGRRDAR